MLNISESQITRHKSQINHKFSCVRPHGFPVEAPLSVSDSVLSDAPSVVAVVAIPLLCPAHVRIVLKSAVIPCPPEWLRVSSSANRKTADRRL